MRRFICGGLITVLLCSLLSCGVNDNTQDKGETNNKTQEATEITNHTQEDTEADNIKRIDIDYLIKGATTGFFLPEFESTADVTYVSQEDKENWREDLVRVLSSSVMQPYTEYDEVPDDLPDHLLPKTRALVPRSGSEGVCLMDVTGDGVPEVCQLWYDGGSLGNCSFQTFDIKTGAHIGGIGSGTWFKPTIWVDEKGKQYQSFSDEFIRYGEWRLYKNIHTGEYCVFGQFNYGIMNKSHFFAQMIYDNDTGFYRSEQVYMYENWVDFLWELEDDVQVCITVDYGWTFYDDQTGWETIDADEAMAFFAEVTSDYRFVEGTQLTVIPWREIEGYGSITQEELAERMADALLSSEQKFVVP